MNTPLITMDREAARAKLKAFRADKHKDAEQLYGEAAAAYEALASGTPLIRLSEAFQHGGLFPDMRPKLAIARSDRREVKFEWRADERTATFDARTSFRQTAASLFRRVDMRQVHGRVIYPKWADGRPCGVRVDGYALVPMVPADVRPKHGALRDWFTLWEVEQWFDSPQTMKAPTDPMLLKHIGGDLYAVLATWDLTPIEQAILEGAMRS